MVQWDPEPTATRFQLQFARNSVSAPWKTASAAIGGSASSFLLDGLEPETEYIVRIRAAYFREAIWGKFSPASAAMKTLALTEEAEEPEPQPGAAGTEAGAETDGDVDDVDDVGDVDDVDNVDDAVFCRQKKTKTPQRACRMVLVSPRAMMITANGACTTKQQHPRCVFLFTS